MSLINDKNLETVLNGVKTYVDIKDGVQPDWNQNDSNADSYVKNRTHWEETKVSNVVNDTNLDFSSCDSVNWGQTKVGYIYESIPLSLITGNEYNVVFDGVTYLCTAFVDGEYGNVVIGNGAFVADCNEDNGLPFAIGNYNSGETYAYAIVADQSQHTISISTTQTVVHKLDSKYLPDDIGVQVDWNETDESSKAYILNKPDVSTLQSNVSTLQSNVSTLQSDVSTLQNGIVLTDTVQGVKYIVQMQDGNLVSHMLSSLDDFTYTTNSDGTYTITGWNQTYLGESSTEMIVPNDSTIII